MARTSFKRTENAPSAETQPADEQESSVALATTVNRDPATYQPTNEFTGAWDRSDVRDPRINLVQKSSKTELHAFGLGAFVLNRDLKLSDGQTPLTLTVVALDKDYQQKLPWGCKDTPNVVKTPAEVRAAGGTLTYKGAKPGTYYGPRAHITVLLKAPEGLTEDDLAFFPFADAKDGRWTVAKITVSSSGFTSMAKEIATLCTYNKAMRKGSIYGQLELTSKEVDGDDASWFIPVVKFVQENPRETLEFFESLRN
jgi:hypothetical protein